MFLIFITLPPYICYTFILSLFNSQHKRPNVYIPFHNFLKNFLFQWYGLHKKFQTQPYLKSQSMLRVAHFENFFSFYLSISLKNLNLSVKQLSSLLQDLKKTFFENSSHFHCWSLDTLLKKSVNF